MRSFWSRIQLYFSRVSLWFNKNLELLFVYSIPFVLTGLIIEAIRFVGFLRKFGLDTPILMTISLTMGLIWFKRESEKRGSFMQTLYNLLQLFCVGVIFFTIVMTVIHIKTGASLLGSGTGQQFINISSLITIVFYIVMLLILPYIAKRFTLRGSVGVALFAAFIYIFILQFNAFSELYLQRAGRALSLISLTEDQRMAKFWNTVFPLMDVVNAHTPPTAVILHPPQKFPWPETGNQFVIRRFLYPRTLIAPEFWDGKQEIDYLLADSGGHNAQYHRDKIGWPADIFPIKKIYLAVPWQKETAVNAFIINDVPFLPQLKEVEPKGSYEGEVKVEHEEESVKLSAKFTVPGHAYVMHSQPITVTSGSTLGVIYQNDHLLQVAPVVSFMDGAGVTRYLEYVPNRKADPLGKIITAPQEKIVMVDVLERIQTFERNMGRPFKNEYQVFLGVDMGYMHPMPYLYGQSIVEVDKNTHSTAESCVEEECWVLLEHLIYDKKWTDAQQVLNMLEPLDRGRPRYAFYLYKVLQGLNKPVEEQVQNLWTAQKYWSDAEYHNLPLFVLNQMGIKKEKK